VIEKTWGPLARSALDMKTVLAGLNLQVQLPADPAEYSIAH